MKKLPAWLVYTVGRIVIIVVLFLVIWWLLLQMPANGNTKIMIDAYAPLTAIVLASILSIPISVLVLRRQRQKFSDEIVTSRKKKGKSAGVKLLGDSDSAAEDEILGYDDTYSELKERIAKNKAAETGEDSDTEGTTDADADTAETPSSESSDGTEESSTKPATD